MSTTTAVELPAAIFDHAASSLCWQISECSKLLPGVSRTDVVRTGSSPPPTPLTILIN